MSDPLKGLRRHQLFIIDDEDVELIIAASKPRLLTLADQRTTQHVVNEAWQLLGLKHEFDWTTVRPSKRSSHPQVHEAIPLDPNRVEPALPDWAIPGPSNDPE
jgi:hypothetical protein